MMEQEKTHVMAALRCTTPSTGNTGTCLAHHASRRVPRRSRSHIISPIPLGTFYDDSATNVAIAKRW